MKKLLRTFSVLLICTLLLVGIEPMPLQAATEHIFEAVTDGKEFTDANDTVIMDASSVNVGDTFTLSMALKTASASGIQVLFAKGPKNTGHFELWLIDGTLAFYAPEINYNTAIYSNIFIADGQEHYVVFAYNCGEWCFYVDNNKKVEGTTIGAVSDSNNSIAIGSLLDGSYEYIGYLKDVRIYDSCSNSEPNTEPKLQSVSKFEALDNGKSFSLGADSLTENEKTVNVGNEFTLSTFIQTETSYGTQVLFAKGPKAAGHYELWLTDGKLAFYAPEINNGISVFTDVFVADGKMHHIAFTYKNGVWYAYLDGTVQICGVTSGKISDKSCGFTFGSLEDGTFEYLGYLEKVRIEAQALTFTQIQELVPDSLKATSTYQPAVHESNYFPEKYAPNTALRGDDRLTQMAALPYIDLSASVGYEGSISKFGDNADWDWSIYEDENGEYVLFETYGAGCIYNFTQHRYPTSEEPTFHFYLDNSDTPTFSIKQSEFGKKMPFLSPVADIYEGPEDGGAGPIWVVRSFVPMEFTSYCKITSTVELLGNNKANGEGGWGHVTYVLYDTAENLETFSPERTDTLTTISSLCNNLTFDPKYSDENKIIKKENLTVKAGETVELLEYSGEGSVAAVKLLLKDNNADPENLSKLRFRMSWDGNTEDCVDAPIGTFFGNEYGYTRCDNAHLMLGTEISPMEFFKGYNYFPMPFWNSAKIELYSIGSEDIVVSEIEIQITPAEVCKYNKASTGYFVSSDYYEKTANTSGQNSLIAELDGTGHMVYGVLSGYGIGSGCEGDVRVFFDGRQSPEIESDGSESWASYGWGFVTPPESNPFSGYNGTPYSNSHWSEVRLTLGDSYFFKNSIRFELEHGAYNDGMGSHSGQIFCYVLPSEASGSRVTDKIILSDEDSLNNHNYKSAGKVVAEKVHSAYANGLNSANSFSGTVYSSDDSITFDVKLDNENQGVVLNRTFSQRNGRQAAIVYVDGNEVTEKIWYVADNNRFYCWADDSFQIPAKYTAGKESVTLTIKPISVGNGNITWNAAAYEVLSVIGTARSGVDNPLPDKTEEKPKENLDSPSQSDGVADKPDNSISQVSPMTGDIASRLFLILLMLTLVIIMCATGIPFIIKRFK